MAYDRYGKYKNKFKLGDIICIQDALPFTYWSLPQDGIFVVRATRSWDYVQISNYETGEAYTAFYKVKNFKFKEKGMTQKFHVGDIVIPSRDGIPGWGGTRAESLYYNENYIITATIEDNVSGKVKHRVDRADQNLDKTWRALGTHGYKSTWYVERHFTMKEKGTISMSNSTNVKAIILDDAGNNVGSISTHDAACNVLVDDKDVDAAIDQKVGDLLRKNPTKAYRVFKYEKTGKLPVLPVTWE